MDKGYKKAFEKALADAKRKERLYQDRLTKAQEEISYYTKLIEELKD